MTAVSQQAKIQLVDLFEDRINRFTVVLFAAILSPTTSGLFRVRRRAFGESRWAFGEMRGVTAAPIAPSETRKVRTAAMLEPIFWHGSQLLKCDSAKSSKVIADGKVE